VYRYLIAPDALHYLFLSDFKDAYPEAKVIGVHSLAEKISHKVKLDGGISLSLLAYSSPILILHVAYGSDPEDTKYGYEDEVPIFFTRTLLSADLGNDSDSSPLHPGTHQQRSCLPPQTIQDAHRSRLTLQPSRNRTGQCCQTGLC
jgi:hypothetical protein